MSKECLEESAESVTLCLWMPILDPTITITGHHIYAGTIDKKYGLYDDKGVK